MPKPPAQLDLSIHARAGKRYVPRLRRRILAAAPLASPALRQLSLVLIGDAMMSKLHQQFFADPATTDVITFPLDLDSRGRAISGELYVCVPMAARQAKLRGVNIEHELLLYCLHGMLHLCGYDDQTPSGYKKMHQMEDKILVKIGIGKVFAAAAAGQGS